MGGICDRCGIEVDTLNGKAELYEIRVYDENGDNSTKYLSYNLCFNCREVIKRRLSGR